MFQPFLSRLKQWSATQQDISAVAIVGSQARGTAQPDSDIDVVILCATPQAYFDNQAWLSEFGHPIDTGVEDYGSVQSLRTIFADGKEVEFGFTTERWASDAELGSTGPIVRDGLLAAYDPKGLLGNLAAKVGVPC
jgi:predicted nucleotidyltransferase